MAVGQVSFHSEKKVSEAFVRYSAHDLTTLPVFSLGQVKRVHVAARDNLIVNRLNKTKVETEVDHEEERQDRLREEGRKKKAEAAEQVRLECGPPLTVIIGVLKLGGPENT